MEVASAYALRVSQFNPEPSFRTGVTADINDHPFGCGVHVSAGYSWDINAAVAVTTIGGAGTEPDGAEALPFGEITKFARDRVNPIIEKEIVGACLNLKGLKELKFVGVAGVRGQQRVGGLLWCSLFRSPGESQTSGAEGGVLRSDGGSRAPEKVCHGGHGRGGAGDGGSTSGP